jgi:hypothetical protein
MKNLTDFRLHKAVNIINDFYSEGLNFHPDDDFREYTDENGNPLKEERANSLNNELKNLCTICEDFNIDIYQLGLLFNGRNYDQVTAYKDDKSINIGFKDSKPFIVNGQQSEDLGDGDQTIYVVL